MYAPTPEACGDDATNHQLMDELRRLRKELKEAQLERDIPKKPRRSLRRSRSEVRLDQETPRLVSGCEHVPSSVRVEEWLLQMAERRAKRPRLSRRAHSRSSARSTRTVK